MKMHITVVFVCGIAVSVLAQNFGIDAPGPVQKLHIGAGNNDGILIGKYNDQLGWSGSGAAPEYSIRFAGYRDVVSNFVGAKIAGVRTNICCSALSQGMDLSFSTMGAGSATVGGDGNLVERMRIGSSGVSIPGTLTAGGASRMWTAKRTGGVGSNSWTDIPGLSIGFTLERSAKVQIVANGTQRTSSGVCHQGYRKVVDGAPYGNASHGERLLVTNTADSWWAIWDYASHVNLGAGNHTITIQTASTSGTACNICRESDGSLQGYTDCDLIIIAVYD